MKFRFTADHFRVFGIEKPAKAAALANALLEAEEAKCERVSGERGVWTKQQVGEERLVYPPTHTALLWNVEEFGEGEE